MTQISHDFHVSVSMINSNQLGLMPTVYKNLMGLFSAKMTRNPEDAMEERSSESRWTADRPNLCGETTVVSSKFMVLIDTVACT
jgi:hypothetical protein